MIHLDTITPIGSGVDRIVYPYPGNDDLCIKIAKVDFQREYVVRGFRDRLFHLLRFGMVEYFDYNFTDVLFAERLKKRGDEDTYFRHLPRCHGFVDTDLGRGVVWQRIRDYDGGSCITLRDCYFNPGLLGDNEKTILWGALTEFFDWQIKYAIMLREMAFVNTLVCRTEPDIIRLYHVDAIGCVDLLPLADHVHWFARMRIRSKVRRFRRHIFKWLGPPEKIS